MNFALFLIRYKKNIVKENLFCLRVINNHTRKTNTDFFFNLIVNEIII